MPKVKWLGGAANQPPPKSIFPDYTLDLFRRYQKANKLTNEQLAPLVGCRNAQAVKDKKAQGTGKWKKDTVLRWSIALHIPEEDLWKALALDSGTLQHRQ